MDRDLVEALIFWLAAVLSSVMLTVGVLAVAAKLAFYVLVRLAS